MSERIGDHSKQPDDARIDEEAHLAALERAGLIRRGRGGILEALEGLERPDDPEGKLLKALLEERESGF